MVRILHLVHQYVPEKVGGVELYTQMVARYQRERGHETAVFTPSDLPATHQAPTPTEENGVHVYRVPIGPRSRSRVFRDTFHQPQLHRALQAALARERPDLVHIQHLMGLPFSLVTAIAEANIPFLITLHDYWYGCANAQLITNDTETLCIGPDAHYHNCGRCLLARAGLARLGWLAPAAAPLMAARNRRLRQILPRARAVITFTEFMRQAYQKMGLPTTNFILSPLGIDVPHARLSVLRQARPPRDPQRLHIGYLGSVAWQKGVHDLVTAVNQLPPDRARLTIYGGLDSYPDYTTQLQRSATHPGIHFAGRISRDAVWEALIGLDLFVLPTRWYEGSPATIQEAFAAGVPVIASNIGAMPEKIRHGVDGLLFPAGDTNALRDTLNRFLVDPDLCDRLRANIQPVRTIQEQVIEMDELYAQSALPQA